MRLSSIYKKLDAPFILLVLLLALGLWLRVYKIGSYMNFLGDEGRDALIVKRMIVDHRFTLLGPSTSVGSMNLGPLYYYFMAIPLLLAGFNPLGPAVMVALLGVLTLYLVYKTIDRFFGNTFLALVAGLLFSASPVVLQFSRSSWNPNIAPFFSIIIIYFLYKIVKYKKVKNLVFVIPSMFILVQSHYMTIAMFPFILFWLLFAFEKMGSKKRIAFIKYFFLSLGIGLFIIFPYLLFNVRHDLISIREIAIFLQNRQVAGSGGIMSYLNNSFHLLRFFYANLLSGGNERVAFLVLLISLFGLILNKKYRFENCYIASLLLSGILVARLYSGQIYDYYLGFLFPALYISLAGIFPFFVKNGKAVSKIAILGAAVFLLYLGLRKSYLFSRPSNQLAKSKAVGDFIAENAEGRLFNLAMISPLKDYRAMPYRYFAELKSGQILDYTDYKDDTYLYVILEENADVMSSPIYEITQFHPTKKVADFNVADTKIEKYVNTEK